MNGTRKRHPGWQRDPQRPQDQSTHNRRVISEELISQARQAHRELAALAEDVFKRELRLRLPDVQKLLICLRDYLKGAHESEVAPTQALIGGVMEPMREIIQRLIDLHGEIRDLEAAQISRQALNEAAKTSETNFQQLLQAFGAELDRLDELAQKITRGQTIFEATWQRLENIADQANALRTSLALQVREVDELMRRISREVREWQYPPNGEQLLSQRYNDLEARLRHWQNTERQWRTEKNRFETVLRDFYAQQNEIRALLGQQSQQRRDIHRLEAIFQRAGKKAGELDPFFLLNRPRTAYLGSSSSIPAEKPVWLERQAPHWESEEPDSALARRAEPIFKLLINKSEEVAPVKIGLIKSAPVPKKAAPPIKTAVVEPPKVVPLAQPSNLSLPELVLATFAAFCARTKDGRPHKSSGRTISKVYRSIFLATGFSHWTEDEFTKAAAEAEERGWLTNFTMGHGFRKKLCHRPTEAGLKLFERQTKKQLPPDFIKRAQATNQEIRSAQAQVREEWRQRKAESGKKK